MKYGIQTGQIYLAADGGEYGCLVIDTDTFAKCDDVVVLHFDNRRFGRQSRIDMFKLAKVRYYLVDVAPEWMPKQPITKPLIEEL